MIDSINDIAVSSSSSSSSSSLSPNKQLNIKKTMTETTISPLLPLLPPPLPPSSSSSTSLSTSMIVPPSLSSSIPVPSSSSCLNLSVSQIESNSPGEDRYSVLINSTMKGFCVIDGHGGYLAADIATSFILDNLCKSIEKLHHLDKLKTDIISKLIEDTIISCDEIILQRALEYQGNSKYAKDFGRAGACIALLLIVEDTLYISNVGDCRAVLIQSCDYHNSPDKDSTINAKKRYRSVDTLSSRFETNDLENFANGVTNKDGITISLNTNNNVKIKDPDNEMNEQVDMKISEEVSDNKENAHENNFDFEKFDSLLPDKKPPTQGILSFPNNIHKARQDVGGDFFSYQTKSLKINGVTTDHCCAIEAECELISRNNKDPQPLRQSDNDRKLYGSRAPMRVAGSLAVTRALGDGYLKISDLSSSIYKEYVPYITCRPTIHARKLLPTDLCLILASDGLWNYLSAKDSIAVIKSDLTEGIIENCQSPLYLTSHEPASINSAGYGPAQGQQHEINKFYTNGIASKLVEKCLNNAAAQYSLPVSELKNMSLGTNRRDYIDDITVIALRLR